VPREPALSDDGQHVVDDAVDHLCEE
jgi:hypothetical protein